MNAINVDVPDLDPDDPRPARVQIANHLRAAILTKKLAPGERLPSQPELSKRYGVARETVKGALRILAEERLIISRQGSGAFVRARSERPVGLRHHVEAAFSQPEIKIAFAGFSGETFHGLVQEPLDRIRAGQLTPQSLHIRILLPDMTQPTAVPSVVGTGEDDPELRKRAERIARRHSEAVVESVQELADLGLIPEATAEVRAHKTAPLFKLYLLNRDDVFFGFYPIVPHTVTVKGRKVEMHDVMGKDVPLFHYGISDDDTSDGAQFVEQSHTWFDSVWNTISMPYFV